MRTRSWIAPLATAAVTLSLTACNSAVEQASDPGTATEGGTFTLATSMEYVPAQLFQGSDAALTISGLVYDTLVEYHGESLTPEPVLATSWDTSADGRTVTFELRKDVTFHDGTPLTAADVIASLKAYATPENLGQMLATAGSITKYTAPDDHTVVLQLKSPLSNLFDLVSMVPILDEATLDQALAGKQLNGTGAFSFDSWTPGTGITFKANPDYWDGAPHLDQVDLKVITDTNTQVSQLRSGQVDLLLTPSNRDLAELEKTDGFQAVSLEGSSRSYYLGFNVKGAGLGDQRVRRAINTALDRERILTEVFQGRGKTTNLPWPEFSPAFDAEKNHTYTGDVAAAKALIAEVGTVPPITLNYNSVLPMQQQLSLIIKDNLEAIGLDVKLQAEDAAAGGNKLATASYPGMWLYPHAFADYTPATLVTSAYPFNAFRNASNFVDPTYQKDATAAWTAVDPASDAARSAYAAINDDLLENSFVANLVTYSWEWAATDKVTGLDWTKRGEIDLSDAQLTR